jgi:hypothetical protein
MSQTRAAIVDALKTVPTLSVSTAPPAVIATNSAWPTWGGSELRNACLTEETWFVFVALPNGSPSVPTEAGDELVGDVVTALWTVAKVERFEPWGWPVDQAQSIVPVLRFTLSASGGI